MGLISMFPGGGGGGGMDLASKPQITFDGRWTDWRVELYSGTPYWEAWFYTSGTLTASKSYTADLWGIGGGNGYTRGACGGSGYTNLLLSSTLPAGQTAVTIGAPTEMSGSAGATTLGDLFSCAGGNGKNGGSGANAANGGSAYGTGDGYPMCRFRDPEKAGEAGSAGVKTGTAGYVGGGGWLDWKSSHAEGGGYGGGAGYDGTRKADAYAHPGALVIRIPI